jgi:hypothetical protein
MAAGLVGLWFGIAPPVAVETLIVSVMGSTQAVSFLFDTETFLYKELIDG